MEKFKYATVNSGRESRIFFDIITISAFLKAFRNAPKPCFHTTFPEFLQKGAGYPDEKSKDSLILSFLHPPPWGCETLW